MDVIQAKEILGGHTCVIGNVPKSLRYTTREEALAYYKDLIEKVKDGGGTMEVTYPITIPSKAPAGTYSFRTTVGINGSSVSEAGSASLYVTAS